MVRLKIFVLAILTTLLIFLQPMHLIGKTTSSEVAKETEEAWEAFKAYMADKKDEAVADVCLDIGFWMHPQAYGGIFSSNPAADPEVRV
jgi:hypothetical protein